MSNNVEADRGSEDKNAPPDAGEVNPIFAIDGETLYSRMWFVTGEKMDWMAALFQKPGGPWEFRYRFRYYSPDAPDPFDGDDEKSVYDFQIDPAKEPLVESIAKIKAAIEFVRSQMDGETHELMLNTRNPKKIMQALAREKWAHLRFGQPAKTK
jgi:hypothetical protein